MAAAARPDLFQQRPADLIDAATAQQALAALPPRIAGTAGFYDR